MTKSFIEQLGFDGFLTEVADIPIRYPDYSEIARIGVDKVYFAAGKPSVLFMQVDAFDENALKRVAEVHRNAWNYQRVMLLYVTSDTEIRIYNCFEKPIYPRVSTRERINSDTILLDSCSIGENISILASFFSRINVDSGTLWTTDSSIRAKIRRDRRVDAYLIQCMTTAAKMLEEMQLPLDIIHALLIRSLFILFLEDRGAAKEAGLYYSIKRDATSYFDILGDKEATYHLFQRLQEQFNGNITTLLANEEEFVNVDHLKVLYNCFFDGEFSYNGLFERERLFNFRIISIGLISEIYEIFLGELKHEKGQFYTPFTLADMILSEVLPTSSREFDYPVLDPACGSGIFLVESYKRLIKRWYLAHENQRISFDVLVGLLVDNIYGIDIDKTAIRVAAFSLYLTLIDQLDPKTLWNSGNHRLPYLIYDPDDDTLIGRQGNNLLCRNTISEVSAADFSRIKLVVGNPPYGKRKLPQDITRYCEQEGFANEYVLPFMHKATQFCPLGNIALVFSSKVLFNTGGGYASFRKWLFNENTVRRIDNLSIYRKAPNSFGGSLFASATCPVCVVYYTARRIDGQNTVKYCSPKTFVKSNMIDGLVIDESDVKFLPMIECRNPYSKIWKIASWGNYYSYQLIRRLSKRTLGQFFLDNGWIIGRGLNADSERQDFIPSPIIGTEYIARYRTDLAAAVVNTSKKFRYSQEGLFDAPVVVFKQGQHNGEIACSLFMENTYFTTTAFAFNGGNVEDKKILTAYLNSCVAKYFLFLTTSSWGVEREQVFLNEVLNLPSPFDGITDSSRTAIVSGFDEIYRLSGDAIANSIRIDEIEGNIERLFEDAFNLSVKDRVYVNDTLEDNFGIFQKGLKADGYRRLLLTESKQYASTLNNTLSVLMGKDNRIKIKIFEASLNDPLQLIVVIFNANQVAVEVDSSQSYAEALQQIDTYLYMEHSDSIYLRKTLKYYDGDRVYIIKPNQKRFWSKMQAYDDGATIVNEILNM